MAKTVDPSDPKLYPNRPKPVRKRRPIAYSNKNEPRKRLKKSRPGEIKRKFLLISIEILGLGITAVLAIMALLGYSASQFSGTHFFSSLLPFAVGVLVLMLVAFIFLIGWWKLRKWLQDRSELLTPTLSLLFALLTGWLVTHGQLTLAYGNFRTLVGGKEEVGRVTIAHQVYATYRRYGPTQLQRIIDRAQEFQPAIKDAADAFGVDVNLLYGIAATESSFRPRNSHDGGRGLFQITRVPKAAVDQALMRLNAKTIELENPRHNAFLAAATFKHYLAEMKGDLFLALLAYNIGPANGGLRFIMQQYGASDFITIQPYLQTLPRDYPIRVLSYALAFRLWQKEGRLLAYEEGGNALHIQRMGIPGLHTGI